MRAFFWLIRLEHIGSEVWLAARDCKSISPCSCGSGSLLVASLGTTDPVSTLQAEYEMHWKETHTHICSWQWKLSSILYLFNMAFFHFFHHLSITFPWQSAPGKTPAENFRGGDPKAAIDKQRAAGQDLPTAALAPPKMVPNMCKYCKSSTICGYKNCLGWFFFGGVSGKNWLYSIVNCAMPFPWFWIQGQCC